MVTALLVVGEETDPSQDELCLNISGCQVQINVQNFKNHS